MDGLDLDCFPSKFEGKAFWVEWREKRGDGWSKSVYHGLLINFIGPRRGRFLVADLSHGLRVLSLINERDKFQFNNWNEGDSEPGDTSSVPVPPEFISLCLRALGIDEELQQSDSCFRKMRMKSIDPD